MKEQVWVTERKNYSFFMPADFKEQLKKVQEADPIMSAMSMSQAVYYIVSKVAKLGIDLDDPEAEKAE